MSRRLSRLTPFLLAPALLLSGCLDDSGPTGPDTSLVAPGKGLTLLLTDAPGDFKAAVVTISEVFLMGQGPGGRISLLENPVTADLLTLQNALATIASGVDVQPGSYSQLRLVVSGAYIEVETANGGSRIYASSPTYAGLPSGASVAGTLQMPSFDQSGLKIDLPGGKLDIGEGQTVVMIDFDVMESFGHQAGNSGKWVMHPSLKATNVTFGGHVLARLQLGTGVTLPTLNGQPVTLAAFTVSLTPVGGGTARTGTLTDADGDGIFEAMFKGLAPGQYTLDFAFPAGVLGTFGSTLPLTVTVTENQTVTHTVTVASAALPASVQATLVLGSGVVLPTVGGSAVTLGQFRAQLTPPGGGTPVLVTFTDANNDATWEANFPGLVPGSYSLTLLAPAGVTATYNPVPPVVIELAGGAAEVRAFTLATAAVTTPSP